MIIVTGGAGFIGSNLIKHLNARGHKNICVVDNLSNGQKIKNLSDLSFIDYFDKDDFLTSASLGEASVIFHLGACSSTTEWDGRYLMRNNYEYSKKLLNICKSKRIPLIYASSASVYGTKESNFVEQESNEKPINAYSFSKKLFDDFVRRNINDADCIYGMRFFNVYGDREQHKKGQSSPIHAFATQLRQSGKLKIFSEVDGKKPSQHRRDFVHVDDCVAAMVQFWEKQPRAGIFNIGSGESHSFVDVAREIINQMGHGEIEFVPFPTSLVEGYQFYTKANLAALRNAGISVDFRSVEDGIKQFISDN